MSANPSMPERITDWLLRTRGGLPPMPLTFIGRRFDTTDAAGRNRAGHGINITGVVIPAHGENPAQRIMLEDMGLAEHRPFAPPQEPTSDRWSELSKKAAEATKPMTAVQEMEAAGGVSSNNPFPTEFK